MIIGCHPRRLNRMGLGLYGHPWDHDQLGPRGGLRALRDLGVDDMALAVAYHAGRWMTPTGGSALVKFLEDGVVHFRPGVDYGEFVPVTRTLVLVESLRRSSQMPKRRTPKRRPSTFH